MTDIAIRVENLGKRYRMGQYVGSGAQYKTLRESLTNAVSAPLHRLRNSKSDNPHSAIRNSTLSTPQSSPFLWALKDISFEVKRGEVLGIIGRNGAGKSTLLKILTRITEPTEGRVEMHGRVGSLLEVGTGFHPELTGRENIYLSGAILGMMRKEIDRKFDEIVEFSGVETYIDTPVKRYSSGMRVRLGFAVAAHLEPEILLIDEVLAVGDAQFQKKCLGKMGDVAKGGRTVLFVSHNMGAIENLCLRTVMLEEGHLIKDTVTKETIATYMAQGLDLQRQDLSDFSRRKGSGEIRISSISLRDGNNRPIAVVQCGEALKIVLRFVKLIPDFNKHINVSISCRTMMGAPVFLQHNRMAGVDFVDLQESGEFICEIDTLNLSPSPYLLSATILVGTDYVDVVQDAFQLTVESGNYLGGGEVPPPGFGPCLMKANWSITNDEVKGAKICKHP